MCFNSSAANNFIFAIIFVSQKYSSSIFRLAPFLSDLDSNSLVLANVTIDTFSFLGLRGSTAVTCNTYFNYYVALNNFWMIIATDGSVYRDSAGCGIFSYAKFAFSMRLLNFTSVFYSEYYTLCLVLLFIKPYSTGKILLITDSLSLLIAISSAACIPELRFIRHLINDDASTHLLCLCW